MTIKKPQYPSLTRRGFVARVAAALSVGPFLFPSLNYAETMKTSTDAVFAAAPATRQAAKSLDPALQRESAASSAR